MKFLRIMGLGFLIAGGAVLFMSPLLRAMGGAWVAVGVILLFISQMAANAEAKRQRLLATGRPGRATVLEVSDTGVTINNNPRVRVKVRIEAQGASPVEATTAMLVSRLNVPRPGEVYEVRFDPQNPNDFVFASSGSPSRPGAGEAPSTRSAPATGESDTISQLERLAALRDQGALTPEEFDAEKRKLLGNR
jgi:hypothetical protein